MDDRKEEEKDNTKEVEETQNAEEVSTEAEVQKEPDYKDKYQRLLAEFSNYQRQKEQEVRSMAAFGNSSLLTKIVDVLDDIDMGLMQDNISEETKGILTLIKEKISHVLLLEGVKEIELKTGDNFDSTTCEALQAIESDENKNKIIQVVRKGYSISDRVLRTAKVIVGK